MARMLDVLGQLMRGEVPPPPIATLLGFSLASVEPGRAVVEFEATERYANPMGTLHGGVLADIADAAMGIAYAARLEQPQPFPPLHPKLTFLNPLSTANPPPRA